MKCVGAKEGSGVGILCREDIGEKQFGDQVEMGNKSGRDNNFIEDKTKSEKRLCPEAFGGDVYLLGHLISHSVRPKLSRNSKENLSSTVRKSFIVKVSLVYVP
ncbi:hypothetical protein LguiB_021500 [Lonicera macranthoides]